ncbi:hypothetical protein SARC_17011, partial [Sphaeroforma arctica JP610]
IHIESLKKLGEVFMTDIFSEETIAKQALLISPTTCLSAHVGGYLPVHCVYSLMNSGIIPISNASKGKTQPYTWYTPAKNVFLRTNPTSTQKSSRPQV